MVDSLQVVTESGLTMSDTLQYFMLEFQQTIALMYQALSNMEPILKRQLEVILSMRLLGNILLFLYFVLIMFVLYRTHLDVQKEVKKFWDVKIKKIWLVLLLAVFGGSLLLFNAYPGYVLAEMNKNKRPVESLEESQKKLFAGGAVSENGSKAENSK